MEWGGGGLELLGKGGGDSWEKHLGPRKDTISVMSVKKKSK